MKPVAKRTEKLVRVLTDAHPEFVSLVNHGANQTPFKSVKIADFRDPSEGDTDMQNSATRRRTRAAKGTDPVVKAAVIAAIHFEGTVFNEEAATKYLADHGYDGVTLAKSENGFTATSPEDPTIENIRTIPLGAGVTMDVGDPPAEGEKTEKSAETPAEPVLVKLTVAGLTAEEIVQRYDAWMAAYAEDKTLAGVMEQGKDGLPPGIYEVNDAFYTALRNCLRENDTASVKSLTAEFGDLIVRLASLFSSLTDDEAQKALLRQKTITVTVVNKSESKDASVAVTTDQPTVAAVKEDEVADEVTAVQPDVSAIVNEAVTPVLDVVKNLTEAVAALALSVKESGEGVADLREQVTKSVERVSALETVRQIRQSADDEGTPATKLDQPKPTVDRMTRNKLGFLSGV